MRRGSQKNRLLDLYVGTPLLNLLATPRRRHRWHADWSRIQRIGILCSPALGDTLLLSAALTDLRTFADRAAPGVELVHLCTPPNLAASELLPGLDRRILIDLASPIATVRRIRAEQFDLLLDFSSWQRLTAFYTLVSGARFTAGFRTAGQHRGRGYDLTVEHRADRHEVDNFRSLLGALCIPTGAPTQIVLPPEPAALPAGDLVVLHLWASGQRAWLREWPEDRWLELARRLAHPETLFLLTGSPADLARTEPFLARMHASGLHAQAFTGTDGFRSLVHLLRRARVVISVNTGVMHLAAIAGVPTVSINGPNRNGRWGPSGPRALGVEAPGPGCGYLHLGFNFDGQSTDCMKRISVELVADAVAEVTAPGIRTSFGVLAIPHLPLPAACEVSA